VGDGAAEESTGATHTNAEGGSAVQEHESALAESGPPPTAATAEVMESSAAAGESLGGGDGGTATDTPSEVAPEAQDRGESSAQAGVSDSNKDN
jgi:hypothetical protein